MAKVGYARVSSFDQNPERQLEQLQGMDKIFVDKMTGSKMDRPQLEACRQYLRENDELYVTSIDRLARNLSDLIKLVTEFRQNGIAVHFIKENLTFDAEANSPINNLLFQLLGAISQFERELIKERQREGIAVAKKKGTVKFGRPFALTPEKTKEIVTRANAGESHLKLAKEFGVCRTSIWRVCKNAKKDDKSSKIAA